MYIMCVCLFSALSHRVGALQISFNIIIKLDLVAVLYKERLCHKFWLTVVIKKMLDQGTSQLVVADQINLIDKRLTFISVFTLSKFLSAFNINKNENIYMYFN